MRKNFPQTRQREGFLPSKTMGCFSGRLMSSASDQKLFCKLSSPFCCSFDEFVEEKVISPSYSSAILTPPPSPSSLRSSVPSCHCQLMYKQEGPYVWLFATPWMPARLLLCPWGFSRHKYRSGLPCPPPGIFPTQWLNPRLLHCRQILYCLSYQGSPDRPYIHICKTG